MYSDKYSNKPTLFLSYFLFRHTFSTFASSFLRGKRAKPTHKQKDMPKANARTEKNQIKISATALLRQWDNNKTVTGRHEKQRLPNSGFKKLAVQWLNQVLFSNQTFVVADSLVLRNRQLLKPANRV